MPLDFWPLRADSWICCPQLPNYPCKNGMYSTSVCNTMGARTEFRAFNFCKEGSARFGQSHASSLIFLSPCFLGDSLASSL